MSETVTSNPSTEVLNTPIVMTASACHKVFDLICDEENVNLCLRAYITGGGCSGFQYGFTFDEKIKEDDMVFSFPIKNDPEHLGPAPMEVRLLVDALSFQYLVGAQIDFVDDIEGAHFVIKNPNAKTTCGCGSSFSA